MTTQSATAALESALRARGLLPATTGSMAEAAPVRPWFLSVLLGFSGWLAGMSCLVFVALLFRPDRAGGFSLIGLFLLGASFALYRVKAGAFLEQLALAFSMAGHLSLAIAIGESSRSETLTAFAVAALQAGWFFLAPNRSARLLAALFGSIAWALTVRIALSGGQLDTSRGHAVSLAPALAGWVVVWAPVGLAAVALVRREIDWVSRGLQRVVRPALTGLLLALAFGTLTSHPFEGLAFWQPASTRTDFVALWPLLSAGAALLALWLAHELRSRALMGAAIAGALLHVFHFYTLVGTTLLSKSAIMAVVGALLLGGGIALERRRQA